KEMRMASEKRSRAIGQITQLAIEALEKGGHAGAASANKITQTLLAAGTDEEARTALMAGTLLRDFAPGGLGGGDIWILPDQGSEPEETEEPSEKRRGEVLEKEITLLAGEADEARAKAAKAEKEANRARLAADKAEAEAERLRRKADQVAAALDRKKGDLE
ncbi:MAG: hypothetical protein ACRDIU_04930, partial [Actinomycetota bacterium]